MITVLIVIAILANANSWVLGASRLTFSAGRNGLLPGIFTKTNRNGVPVNALIAMQAIYTGVIVIAGLLHLKADNLVGIVSQDFIVLYVVSIIAFIISERNEGGVSGASWLIALLSLVLCGIILTGFTWWICIRRCWWRWVPRFIVAACDGENDDGPSEGLRTRRFRGY